MTGAPMAQVPDSPAPTFPGDLLWGYKLVGTDLSTDDNQGGRYRYHLGQWASVREPWACTRGKPCPTFPGDGLCVAKTLAGAQSGGARLGASVLLLVGYYEQDILGAEASKVRVSRLYVHPDPLDPVAVLTGPRANLTGANLYGADLYGADLTRANLTGACGSSFTRLPAGYAVVAGLVVRT